MSQARRFVTIASLVMGLSGSMVFAQVSPGPLSEPHSALEGNSNCLKCHASRSDGMDARCLDCHGEIALLLEARRGFHARTEGKTCAGCHPDHAGRDFALIEWPDGGPESFDHARTGWPLRGRHAATKCRDCHRGENRQGPVASAAKVTDPMRSWVGLETACASCHEDPHKQALGPDCTRCHTVLDWKKTPGFDHDTVDFPLSGKHETVPCARCHQQQGSSVPVYKPLPHAECSTCHQDPHGGRLGPKCASCHTAVGWREVPKSAFDHDRTRFSLRGAHTSVACASCHDPGKAWGAKPAFAACGDCHRDAHAGQATLGGTRVDCDSCHSVESFRTGRLAAARHAPERFPLVGKHAAVACSACHKRDRSSVSLARLGPAGVEIHPAHERCATCHEDAHAGQLASRPDQGECASCHGVEGWKPSRFTVEQHSQLAFPLEATHATTACADCHKPLKSGTAQVALRGIARECAGCHSDPHRFAPLRACSDCHDARAFAPSLYGPAEHARAALPLEGAHRAVPCVACHTSLRRAVTKQTERILHFNDDRRQCVECHSDPHGGQFRATQGGACEACHEVAAFRPATRFVHDRDTAFKLGAAHARVACARCHSAPAEARSPAVVVYRGVTTRCADCHGPGGGRKGEPT